MESKYLSLSKKQREKRRQQGQGNILYVRYADDFVVIHNGTKAEAQTIKEELGELLDTMGLTLSEEKTKVTHITEGFDFLGYRVIRSIGTSGKMVPKVLIPEKAMERFRHKVREELAPSTTKEPIGRKIQRLNWFIRGWCEYYRSTSSPGRSFHKLDQELFWDFAHWLGRKYESNMPAIMQRFRKDNTFGNEKIKLVMPSEYKAKRNIARTWHNPYTEKEEVQKEKERIKRESLFSYGDIPLLGISRQRQGDLREEVLLRDGPICAWCKREFNPWEVQVDHIKPYARFKRPEEADRMENMQVLCTEHHRAKTKTDLKVLSRVR
jgi:RNA-directed DNA polymerase